MGKVDTIVDTIVDATIVVATFGDNKWIDLADSYAMSSARQFDMPIVRVHGGESIAESRNAAADLVRTEWVCFLDADDLLSDDYFIEMSKATGDLRVPRLKFWSEDDGDFYEPFDLTRRNIDFGNPCPIGTLIRTSMVEDVGGFWEEPAYEDWSLFRRAWLLGATIEHTRAEYMAYNIGGRNNSVANPAVEIEKIRSSHDKWKEELLK